MADIPLRNNDDNKDFEMNHERRPRRTFAIRAEHVMASNILFKREQKDVYYSKYTCKPNCSDQVGGPPIFILTITIAQIAVFIYYATVGDISWFTISQEATVSPLIFNPYLREQVWRFLTYMMLHGGIYHIVANSIVQIIFGIPLELVHGSFRVMGIYFAGVIAGSLGSSVFDVGTWLIGASGGDFALMFAYIANVVINWDSMKRMYAILRLVFVLTFVFCDFAVAVWERYNGTVNNTSYAAHIGGSICGLTLGIAILKNFEKQVWEGKLFKISIVVFCVLVVAAIIFNIACPCYNQY